ncbi:hypothetical protein AWENTII_011905 [Aspergillus wentii]|nr:hypothetical protein MW887_008344 [Aspergillus wentii]
MLRRWTLERVLRSPSRVTWTKPTVQTNRLLRCFHHRASNPRKSIIAQHHRNHPRPRTLTTAAIPTILVPPVIFVGLLVSLWAWKCFWIIALQNKLLYLSWLPPFSRSDEIASYETECRPVQWEKKQIRSLDGTKLAVCEGHIPHRGQSQRTTKARKQSVVICYFQGNSGSTPLRLPLLSQFLRAVTASSQQSLSNVDYTIAALSYRGYWTSSGRATESGIKLDTQAFLDWVSETYSAPDTDLEIILWGHSLGSAVASDAVSTYLSRHKVDHASKPRNSSSAQITGLIMEAPTSNIKDMLISLYPQKWLPYRYLWPFSWNNWCNATALERLAVLRDQNKHQMSTEATSSTSSVPPILIVSAEKDEVIPPYVAGQLEDKANSLGLDIERKDVLGAMHTEAPMKMEGRNAMVDFIKIVSSTGKNVQ